MLLSFCLLFAMTGARAQNSGTITFGANVLHAAHITAPADNNRYNSLQVRAGGFATNSLAIGLCVEAGLGGNKTVPYGITLFSRWYSGKGKPQTIKFFAEAGAGIADYQLQQEDELAVTGKKNWMKPAVSVSAGVNIFPVNWIAIELAPEYRYIGGTQALNRLGMSAGIRLFLSESLFLKTFPDKFKSMH